MSKEVVTLDELELYVNILTDLNDGRKLSYNELIINLLLEFGVKTNIEELDRMYSSNQTDEYIDLELMYKNMC